MTLVKELKRLNLQTSVKLVQKGRDCREFFLQMCKPIATTFVLWFMRSCKRNFAWSFFRRKWSNLSSKRLFLYQRWNFQEGGPFYVSNYPNYKKVLEGFEVLVAFLCQRISQNLHAKAIKCTFWRHLTSPTFNLTFAKLRILTWEDRKLQNKNRKHVWVKKPVYGSGLLRRRSAAGQKSDAAF